GELDPEDREDRPVEKRPVVDRDRMVEPEPEGEVPRGGDQARVRRELPEPVAGERRHLPRTCQAEAWHVVSQVFAARSHCWTGTARRTSTTRSCCSREMPAHSGRQRFS